VAGLGLGLFISQQIVAAHGGSITVESRIGEGALFRVCLPLQENSPMNATSD
jgi:signal transduction histidine kinase